ncbi:hypothetical protein ATO7_08612 [Oceanococcus atlanticus]|uniref:Membrane dipeptidase (Peptidase family M19) n=1 Tax=Oceanococcus atlanticus TaxID=1317117 RepID=A0A1Y1SDL8_9GAMM|nr:hypothetical protein [Oceanococcus atlanticus]ORE87088.1 hypothetical protein ATO7_08612 [Oceanococcus atlanticus]
MAHTNAKLASCLALGLLLAGCNGGRESSPRETTTDQVFSAANQCFVLESGEGFVSADNDSALYTLSANADAAAAFYFKPARLGDYLLLSHYSRAQGERGNKSLLGISDPLGELLDDTGNFIGEVGYVVSAVGDILDFATDPLAPLGGPVRDLGEGLGGVGGQLGDQNVAPRLAMVDEASDLAVWTLTERAPGKVSLKNAVTGQTLAVANGQLGLTSAARAAEASEFRMIPTQGCDSYPEASLNATVLDKRGPAKYLNEVALFTQGPNASLIGDEDVYGFIDAHSHITAYEFIGGRVNYGDPFHKFGVDHALDNCAVNHGPQGLLGLVETVTSGHGQPAHQTRGWPDFPFWPRHNSLQHHQSYYRWIERAHLAGLKILVNHFTGNEVLCQLNPQKQNACDFEDNWRLQAQRIFEMQDYIDAQHGGPGQGWFRIVDTPADARRIIDEGKLAVVLGIEISKIFNCGEFLGMSECSVEEMTERLDAAYRVGIRHIFPIHKFDNAFGGVVPDEALGIGTVLYVGNLAETGHMLEFEECPENFVSDSANDENAPNPLGIIDQLLFQLEYVEGQVQQTPIPLPPLIPATEQGLCNVRGLTEIGHAFIDELMKRRMIIEVDHSSRKVIDRIFELAEVNGYPGLTSSHDWLNSEELLDRLVANGGNISRFVSAREQWVDRLNKVDQRPASQMVAGLPTTGMASDVNGIASLPGNSGEAGTPLYPFTSVDGRVQFEEQVTGDHVFNLYEGRGVAHYGLYPDQIADMQRYTSERSPEEIDRALRQFFSSAEAYLRMWERTEAWRPLE